MQFDSPAVQWIPLSRIDSSDSRFRTRSVWKGPDDRLQRLISSVGITTPLRLESRHGGDFRVVSGFRRLEIVRTLGHTEVPALVVRGEPDRLFLSAICENMCQASALDLCEKAAAAVCLLREFHYSEERLVSEILPVLELPPNRHQLRQLLVFAELPMKIRKAVSERLTPDSARILKEWSSEDAGFFIDLVERYQLGTNKQKQLLKLLEDLHRRDECTIREVWESSGAAAVDRQAELAPSDRFQEFRRLLRLRQFPIMSAYETRAEDLRRALDLPKEVALHLPPYLEGDHLDIHLRTSSPAELLSTIHHLEAAANRPEMGQLFELL